ncbi:terminase large subunit domain-containing protein [Rhodococcus marinonascens]|uniref:terminase large subunit domain-containing protein n=1 Tax=Rhodococcus marinonascens TaxID=38311 RepID=UPI0009338CFD|nr:terminase family protein [Rhodococcus marinonascens]
MSATLAGIDPDQLIDDPAYFAEKVIGEPLWDYQTDFARSPARYRVMCAGRQVGKSRVLAVCALHTAFIRSNVHVLVISNGEDSSKRVLDDCAGMARRSPLLRGSVLDDQKQLLTFANGSTIQSIPASEARARGNSIDLLIVDEAAFISMNLWQAAEPSILARTESRVILASTPWGSSSHFFRSKYLEGLGSPSARVRSWHWPSTASPIADHELIDEWRRTWSPIKFKTEIEAEWTDETGAYFTMEELDNAVADYALIPPEQAHGQTAVAGIDWGFNDSNALVLLGVLDDQELNRGKHLDELVYFLPWLEAHHRMPYSDFIDRIAAVAREYGLVRLISESNGVGQMPSQVLLRRIENQCHLMRQWTPVTPVTTDNRRKTSGYGALKVLLQQGRIVLPRHAELLKQLHALTYEMTPTGAVRIEVPEAAGHDDLADALMQVMCAVEGNFTSWRPDNPRPNRGKILTTPGGTRIPEKPRCWDLPHALMRVRGRDKGDGW